MWCLTSLARVKDSNRIGWLLSMSYLQILGPSTNETYMCRKYGLSNDPQEAFNHNHDVTDLAELGGEKVTENKDEMAAQLADNKVSAIMLEAGIIFHSIFIGIDIGINSDPGVVRPLMIALMFHQVSLMEHSPRSFI